MLFSSFSGTFSHPLTIKRYNGSHSLHYLFIISLYYLHFSCHLSIKYYTQQTKQENNDNYLYILS